MAHKLKYFETDPGEGNCDTVLTKMGKRNRSHSTSKPSSSQKCSRNQSASLFMPTIASSLRSKGVSLARQQNFTTPKTPVNSTNAMSKPLSRDNSALVEVTVKTHSKKPKFATKKAWNKLLKPKGIEEAINNSKLSTFNSFDPLRTLHFLARELQSRLNMNRLGDPYMQQIVLNMEEALTRIPPEVTSSSSQLQKSSDTTNTRSSEIKRSRKDMRRFILHNEMNTAVSKIPEQTNPTTNLHLRLEDLSLDGVTSTFHDNILDSESLSQKLSARGKPAALHKCSQTGDCLLVQSEHFQKQLATGTKKLEKSCKSLQLVCKQLQAEKEELELLLLSEKDTVKFLNRRIEEMEAEKVAVTNYTIEQLKQENNGLTEQLQKQKAAQANLQLDQGVTLQELKSLVQKLQKEKMSAEQETISLRHQLTITDMEKEKYMAILNVRDHQVNEIRNEMLQLQEVVNEQLRELQKTPFISSPSSQSTVFGNFIGMPWQQMSPEITTKLNNKEIGDNLSMSPDNSEAGTEQMLDRDVHLFREVPSGDVKSACNSDPPPKKGMKTVQTSSTASSTD